MNLWDESSEAQSHPHHYENEANKTDSDTEVSQAFLFEPDCPHEAQQEQKKTDPQEHSANRVQGPHSLLGNEPFNQIIHHEPNEPPKHANDILPETGFISCPCT